MDNPLCGDRVTIDVTLSEGRITKLGHKVQGCALCQATAGLLMETAIGRRVEDIAKATEELTRFIAEEDDTISLSWPKLAVFQPVRKFKNRLECVRLPRPPQPRLRRRRRLAAQPRAGEPPPHGVLYCGAKD